MTLTLICIALLGLLVFGLGFAISTTRGLTGTVVGHSPDPTDLLHKLVRAHGNTAEYAPMIAILAFLIASREPPIWTLWSIAGATLCRYLIVAGLICCPTLARPHPLRFIGALGTYIFGLVLCVALLLSL